MGSDSVTKDDLRDLRDTLTQQITEGFAGVHRRQDTTNGRISSAEVTLADHGARLKSVEHEVFPRHRRRPASGDADDAAALELRQPITGRDVKIVWLTLAALVTLAELTLRIGPALARLAVLR